MVILLPSMFRPMRTLDVRLTPYISLMSYDYLEYMAVTVENLNLKEITMVKYLER